MRKEKEKKLKRRKKGKEKNNIGTNSLSFSFLLLSPIVKSRIAESTSVSCALKAILILHKSVVQVL